jgi:chemotaxis protein CheY-P-specific phosphatase CheC
MSEADAQALGHLAVSAADGAAQSLARLVGLADAALRADGFRVGGWQDVRATLGDQRGLAVEFRLSGAVRGGFWMVAAEGEMLRVASRLRGVGVPACVGWDVASRGAVAEAGNVVVSSFLNVVAQVVRRACLPSVPEVAHLVPGEWSPWEPAAHQAMVVVPLGGRMDGPWRAGLAWALEPASLVGLLAAVKPAQDAGAPG